MVGLQQLRLHGARHGTLSAAGRRTPVRPCQGACDQAAPSPPHRAPWRTALARRDLHDGGRLPARHGRRLWRLKALELPSRGDVRRGNACVAGASAGRSRAPAQRPLRSPPGRAFSGRLRPKNHPRLPTAAGRFVRGSDSRRFSAHVEGAKCCLVAVRGSDSARRRGRDHAVLACSLLSRACGAAVLAVRRAASRRDSRLHPQEGSSVFLVDETHRTLQDATV